MKTASVLITALLLLANSPCFGASLIVNGSFEEDGYISDIKSTPPTGWDVTMDSKFSGRIDDSFWSSDGDYSARLESGATTFTAGDKGFISQHVDLTDANEIIFDIYLIGYRTGYKPWDGNEATAFISLDNSPNNIWESALTDDGSYYDITVPLDSNLTGNHTLNFGVRINVSQRLYTRYRSYWDFSKFDAYCGGFGFLAGDLNRDCYVDFVDYSILANNWMKDTVLASDDLFDFEYDGKIDLFDAAIFVDDWLLCSNWADDDCFDVPLDLEADINLDGIVNMLDYNILVANWGSPTETKADLDDSGAVDHKDLAIMNSQWLQRSWLYKY